MTRLLHRPWRLRIAKIEAANSNALFIWPRAGGGRWPCAST